MPSYNYTGRSLVVVAEVASLCERDDFSEVDFLRLTSGMELYFKRRWRWRNLSDLMSELHISLNVMPGIVNFCRIVLWLPSSFSLTRSQAARVSQVVCDALRSAE